MSIKSYLFLRYFVYAGIALLICFQEAYGQLNKGGIVKGIIRDTLLDKDCPFAVVAILDADSNLLDFTRSKKDGSFIFHEIPKGHYRVLITHPAYSDYVDSFTTHEDVIEDLGVVSLPPRSDKLESVIVTPRTALMRMRGDTLEYNTANVKLKVNASVEELLKRLPGVQIDAQGNITINGERIQRLLVDGEDLFGGDPTIVTRNFNGDMISRVQVLDKKSKQAEFTGIDDGQKTKTLNLTLKEDSKRGYFTKAEIGGDMNRYYNANALIGSFKGSRQLAAYGMGANTGITGFSENVEGAGGLSLSAGVNDALGSSAGAGIPKVTAGGAHYANRWNNEHLAGNYQYGQMITYPIFESISEQILQDSVYQQNQKSQSMNSMEQHVLSADYSWAPDTITAFRYTVGGVATQGRNQFASTTASYFNDTVVNNSRRTIQSKVQNRSFDGNAMWRIIGRKNRVRVFSIVVGISNSENETNGYLYSINTFYQPNDSLLNADTIDQRKLITNNSFGFNTSLNYTQPLWSHAVLAGRYTFIFNRSQSIQSTFNKGDGKYAEFIDSLSSNFQNIGISQIATLNLQGNNHLLGYTIGGDVIQYTNKQKDLLKDSGMQYHYFNYAPKVNIRYAVNNFKGISFDYQGASQQPSISQLQPVQNNSDPLHITLGNPNLHPSFSHSFWLSYHSLKPIVFNAGLNFGIISNTISTRTYTDSLGRQISQAVNTDGANSAATNLSVSRLVKSINWDVGLSSVFTYSRNVNYVNTVLSKNDNYNIGEGINLGKYVADKYSFRLNSSVSYSYSKSSVNTAAITHYWSQTHSAELGIFVLPEVELQTDCNFTWRQKTSVFDANNQTIAWNARVSKNLLENRLNVRLQVNDILGQNVGINRSAIGNQISQSNYNVIGRYWMIAATYRFIRHGKLK